ncbi:MAG: hypothetical protein Kow002_16920 [Anaerolineales bacterium]
MSSETFSLPADYWQNFKATKKDIEYLQTHLFESETPKSTGELVGVLIEERIRAEKTALSKKRKSGGKPFLPKESYAVGDKLTFPALDWISGQVKSVRPGINPGLGEFDVITVEMEDGQERMFAASLADHPLNEQPASDTESDDLDPSGIQKNFGKYIERELEKAFADDEGLVRIAGRWFPRALLVDVNEGHLNLAEAVLDMAGGEPLPTAALLKDVELPEGVNENLTEFSLNFALQEDGRFDEVGPAGEVLWCLKRLEPEGVQEVPLFLRYQEIEYDRSALTEDMLALEARLDDELSEAGLEPEADADSVTICLTYPHWRAGTLPITQRVQSMFPTAYEAPRVRFMMVDGRTGDQMPAWVVRKHAYVYGLRAWYEKNDLMPGTLVQIRRGENPGEVIISANTHRTKKDWVRTVIVGADGGVVFALLKQPVTAEINDRMAFAVADTDMVDALWKQDKKRPFERLVKSVMHELTKLNPQGHIHAQELYAAVNIVRRTPPAPLFALLATNSEFVHVGDLHFRMGESLTEETA